MLSVLLLFISESIASVQIVVAVHISENGPECDKDWNASVTIDTCIRNICCKKRKKKKKLRRNKICLFQIGKSWSVVFLVLLQTQLTNQLSMCTKPVKVCFFNLYLYCLCAEAGLVLVAWSLGRVRNSSPSGFGPWCTWSCVLIVLKATAGLMPVKKPRYVYQDHLIQGQVWWLCCVYFFV